MKFTVLVEKMYHVTGEVEIEAETANEAVSKFQNRIDHGEVQTNDPAIKWDEEPIYEDFSFQTVGVGNT